MDSEDERDPRRDGLHLHTCLDRRDDLELRLYEAKESHCKKNKVAYYRLRRFFASIEGFHKGTLDLTGRHATRYEELSIRWKEFTEGVMKTISQIHEVEPHRRDDEGDIMMNECLKKWNLDGAMSTSELLSQIGNVTEIMEVHPEPRIQSLILTSLPPEVLDIVMDNEDSTVPRLFGATCRYLNTVARPYIFKDRTLKFNPRIDLKHVWSLEAKREPIYGYYTYIAEQAQSHFQQYAETLQRQQDIQKYTVKMTITGARPYFAQVTLSAGPQPPWLLSLYDAVCDTIPHFRSLTLLVFQNWDLSEHLVEQLENLTVLHTLDVQDCTFSSLTLPQLPSVREIFLYISKTEQLESEYVIGMCPAVENVSIVNYSEDFESEPFDEELNPFGTLRKYQHGGIYNIITFINLGFYISNAITQSPNGRIPLTHLKISFEEVEIDLDVLFRFIDLLGSTSLESLVLIGMSYVQPDLLERLARVVPDLLELTLSKSTHNETGQCRWPCTPWTYALSFPHFNRLRHFGWNINYPEDSYTPRSLLFFEQEKFPSCDDNDDPTSDENGLAVIEDSSVANEDDIVLAEDCYDEIHFITKDLHRRCPSLEYMVLTNSKEEWIYPYRRTEVNGEIFFKHSQVEMELMWERNPQRGWDYYEGTRI